MENENIYRNFHKFIQKNLTVDVPIAYQSVSHIPINIKEEVNKIINLYNQLGHDRFIEMLNEENEELYSKFYLKIANIIDHYEICNMEKKDNEISIILS